MAFSFSVLLPVMLREPYKSKHVATLQKQWKGLVAIGVYMAANISLNNLSLVLITLSLNQVIRCMSLLYLVCKSLASFDLQPHRSSVRCRSAIPVCTAILAIFIERKVPSREEAIGLVVLTAGVMVAVWEGTVSGSVTGLVLCCTGTVCNAAMMSTTGKVMSEKLDVLRLAFYTAPVSCAILLPLFYIREVRTTHQKVLTTATAVEQHCMSCQYPQTPLLHAHCKLCHSTVDSCHR